MAEKTLVDCDTPALLEVLEEVDDPRRDRRKRHSLQKVLVMALFAVAGGASSWSQIEWFAKLHEDWFAKYTDMTEGVPSHDTFRRVFGLLIPQATQSLLQSWFEQRGIDFSNGRQICIDGKVIRGASSWAEEGEVTNLVTAYCPNEGISLAHVIVPEKGNEITAAPDLIALLHLQGAVVSGDAAYTQKKIVAALVSSKADYCLALKENQSGLKAAVEALFARNLASTRHYETTEKTRGRIEVRRLSMMSFPDDLHFADEWANLKTIVRLATTRSPLGEAPQVVPEIRYYISSLKVDPKTLLGYIRSHWKIENNLHRTLDVHFKEDSWRMRQRNAAANLSVLRKISGSMLSQIDPSKAVLHKQMSVNGSSKFRDRLINMEF